MTAFQRSAGLVADGIAGPKTQPALQKADVTERRAPVDKPDWLVLAEALNGLKETPGAKNNPEVVKLFADAGFPGIKTDSTVWCAVFVNAALERAGHRGSARMTRVVLTTGHRNHDTADNAPANLAAWCQRCHMLHARPDHMRRRWRTLFRRKALGDLFRGP